MTWAREASTSIRRARSRSCASEYRADAAVRADDDDDDDSEEEEVALEEEKTRGENAASSLDPMDEEEEDDDDDEEAPSWGTSEPSPATTKEFVLAVVSLPPALALVLASEKEEEEEAVEGRLLSSTSCAARVANEARASFSFFSRSAHLASRSATSIVDKACAALADANAGRKRPASRFAKRVRKAGVIRKMKHGARMRPPSFCIANKAFRANAGTRRKDRAVSNHEDAVAVVTAACFIAADSRTAVTR